MKKVNKTVSKFKEKVKILENETNRRDEDHKKILERLA
jgi:hypothetical protein